MPKMRRVIESLRTGKCSLGGPSKCVTNLLELGGGHHLTCCTAVVGDDWTRVVGCLRQNGFGLTLSSQKSECKCSSCDVLILLNSLSYACQACARAHINSPCAREAPTNVSIHLVVEVQPPAVKLAQVRFFGS